MKKVLITVTSHSQLGQTGKPTGYYLPEVTHPFFALKEAGIAADILSPKGGKAPLDERSRDASDPKNREFLETPELARKLEKTLSPADIRLNEYSAILFAGGHGTMWDFPEDAWLSRMTAWIYENGGAVAAVCHGPAALVNVRLSNGKYLVDGQSVTAFSNDEENSIELTSVMPFLLESKLVERGGKYSKAGLWKPHVVTSGRLITGQNPASAEGVGQALAQILAITR